MPSVTTLEEQRHFLEVTRQLAAIHGDGHALNLIEHLENHPSERRREMMEALHHRFHSSRNAERLESTLEGKMLRTVTMGITGDRPLSDFPRDSMQHRTLHTVREAWGLQNIQHSSRLAAAAVSMKQDRDPPTLEKQLDLLQSYLNRKRRLQPEAPDPARRLAIASIDGAHMMLQANGRWHGGVLFKSERAISHLREGLPLPIEEGVREEHGRQAKKINAVLKPANSAWGVTGPRMRNTQPRQKPSIVDPTAEPKGNPGSPSLVQHVFTPLDQVHLSTAGRQMTRREGSRIGSRMESLRESRLRGPRLDPGHQRSTLMDLTEEKQDSSKGKTKAIPVQNGQHRQGVHSGSIPPPLAHGQLPPTFREFIERIRAPKTPETWQQGVSQLDQKRAAAARTPALGKKAKSVVKPTEQSEFGPEPRTERPRRQLAPAPPPLPRTIGDLYVAQPQTAAPGRFRAPENRPQSQSGTPPSLAQLFKAPEKKQGLRD